AKPPAAKTLAAKPPAAKPPAAKPPAAKPPLDLVVRVAGERLTITEHEPAQPVATRGASTTAHLAPHVQQAVYASAGLAEHLVHAAVSQVTGGRSESRRDLTVGEAVAFVALVRPAGLEAAITPAELEPILLDLEVLIAGDTPTRDLAREWAAAGLPALSRVGDQVRGPERLAGGQVAVAAGLADDAATRQSDLCRGRAARVAEAFRAAGIPKDEWGDRAEEVLAAPAHLARLDGPSTEALLRWAAHRGGQGPDRGAP
ncbi:MAG: hypothetical protein ACRD0D_01490, partial [Acidimicrobiales bacterium]